MDAKSSPETITKSSQVEPNGFTGAPATGTTLQVPFGVSIYVTFVTVGDGVSTIVPKAPRRSNAWISTVRSTLLVPSIALL